MTIMNNIIFQSSAEETAKSKIMCIGIIMTSMIHEFQYDTAESKAGAPSIYILLHFTEFYNTICICMYYRGEDEFSVCIKTSTPRFGPKRKLKLCIYV